MKKPKYVDQLYPLSGSTNQLPYFLESLLKRVDSKILRPDDAIYGKLSSPEQYSKLSDKYSVLPDQSADALSISKEIVDDLFEGILRWRSPNLQHNVGSPVNTAASAMYSLALDENIFSINDGLAGNALIAEGAVANILSELADLDTPGAGLFVFGGTATNLYAAKVGLQKAHPETAATGTPNNIKMLVAEDAHFSHTLSADWLGIGTNNVIEMTANPDRTSNIVDAEQKIRQIIEDGDMLSVIILNGGSTYSHTIDNISDFVVMRDKLVSEYQLSYSPHIHVDSVIGWGWLFFKDYNFITNPLEINSETIELIKKQYEIVSGLKDADSWGADFHKGIGGCPVDCSIVMFNNPQDLFAISKYKNYNLTTHQLATEFTNYAPSEFTLETSRSAGTGLAALAALRSLGREGYQRNLANLIESTSVFRKHLQQPTDIQVMNGYSLGFSTMVRLYPPELSAKDYPKQELSDDNEALDKIALVNTYVKAFHAWDFETRIVNNNGPSPSFSSSFLTYKGEKVSALKYYPTSPHYSPEYAALTASTLISQKSKFDSDIWRHTKQD